MNMRKIGAAFVDIFVRRERLKSDLDAAEKDVSASVGKMEARTEGLGEGFRKAAGKAQSIVGVFTGLLGAAGAVAAAIVGIVKLTESWERATQLVNAASADQLEKMRAISQQAAELARSAGGDGPDSIAGAFEKMRREASGAGEAVRREVLDNLSGFQKGLLGNLIDQSQLGAFERGAAAFGAVVGAITGKSEEVRAAFRQQLADIDANVNRQLEALRLVEQRARAEKDAADARRRAADDEQRAADITSRAASERIAGLQGVERAEAELQAKLNKLLAEADESRRAGFEKTADALLNLYVQTESSGRASIASLQGEIRDAELARIATVTQRQLEAEQRIEAERIASAKRAEQAMLEAVRKMTAGFNANDGLRNLNSIPRLLHKISIGIDSANSRLSTGF